MKVQATELSEADRELLGNLKARAAEAVEHCVKMKGDTRRAWDWNPINLELAEQFQRVLERAEWTVDDVHRLSNEFTTADAHVDVNFWYLRRVVEAFVGMIHRNAWRVEGGRDHANST